MDKLDTEEQEVDKTQKEPSTVYDLVQTPNDEKWLRKMLDLPPKKEYLKKVEKDPMVAILHLAVFFWNQQGATAAARYIDLLPSDYLRKFYALIATTQQYHHKFNE